MNWLNFCWNLISRYWRRKEWINKSGELIDIYSNCFTAHEIVELKLYTEIQKRMKNKLNEFAEASLIYSFAKWTIISCNDSSFIFGCTFFPVRRLFFSRFLNSISIGIAIDLTGFANKRKKVQMKCLMSANYSRWVFYRNGMMVEISRALKLWYKQSFVGVCTVYSCLDYCRIKRTTT